MSRSPIRPGRYARSDLSAETRSAPVSIACAAIQTSFVGIGRPLALSDAMILEYRSAVTGPTGTNDAYGLSRKDLSSARFCSSRGPCLKPDSSSPTTLLW